MECKTSQSVDEFVDTNSQDGEYDENHSSEAETEEENVSDEEVSVINDNTCSSKKSKKSPRYPYQDNLRDKMKDRFKQHNKTYGMRLEKCLYNFVLQQKNKLQSERPLEQDEFRKLYVITAQQVDFELQKHCSNADCKKLLSWIESNSMWFESQYYKKSSENDNELLQYIKEPIKVEDGIHECRNCGSKRAYTYQAQTRSADEATSLFVQCSKCSKKWVC